MQSSDSWFLSVHIQDYIPAYAGALWLGSLKQKTKGMCKTEAVLTNNCLMTIHYQQISQAALK